MKQGSYEAAAADHALKRLVARYNLQNPVVVEAAQIQQLADPSEAFAAVARDLPQEGYAIVVVPNSAHALNRLKYFLRGKKPPAQPVGGHQLQHNPHTVIKQLVHAGLKVERVLSVVNVPSSLLVRLLPQGLLLAIEKHLQTQLASSYAGTYIFFLVKKV